jgi:predicted dehydrogenase
MCDKLLSRRNFSKMFAFSAFGLTIPSYSNGLKDKAKRIKVAQIGTAHSHAGGKYQTLQRLSHLFDIVGIAEPNKMQLEQAKTKSEFKDVKWLSEEEILNDNSIQAVLVETDFDDLVTTAIKYAEKGFHIHIDKPPGKSLSDLKKLFDICLRRNLIIQMGYMFRYNPAFVFCINAVKNGLLGDIYQVDGVISKKINVGRRPRLAKTYGGAMMLLGCHLIDIVFAICGKPDKIQSFKKQTFKNKDTLYDNELTVFEYLKISASVRSSLVEVGGMPRRQFVVSGENGTIEIKPLEPPKLRLVLEKAAGGYPAGTQYIDLPQVQGRYDDQLADFARQIRGEKSTDFSMQHDLGTHETLLKACDIM